MKTPRTYSLTTRAVPRDASNEIDMASSSNLIIWALVRPERYAAAHGVENFNLSQCVVIVALACHHILAMIGELDTFENGNVLMSMPKQGKRTAVNSASSGGADRQPSNKKEQRKQNGAHFFER